MCRRSTSTALQPAHLRKESSGNSYGTPIRAGAQVKVDEKVEKADAEAIVQGFPKCGAVGSDVTAELVMPRVHCHVNRFEAVQCTANLERNDQDQLAWRGLLEQSIWMTLLPADL